MNLNVAYSSDENYVKYAGISMISLFENNKNFEQITVYFIENELSKESKKILGEIVNQYNRKLVFLCLEELVEGLDTHDAFSKCAYARLYLQKIPDINKIVYLDCDLIIHGDLSELWNMDIKEYDVAAVQDSVRPEHRRNIGLNIEDSYFNTGMLVMNLEKWRMKDICHKAERFIEDYYQKYHKEVGYHDQGVLNALCKDAILYLPAKYNLMGTLCEYTPEQIKKLYHITTYFSAEDRQEALDNPVIIHFVEGIYGRPWRSECTHPYRSIYVDYMERSPWRGQFENVKLKPRRRLERFLSRYGPFFIVYIVKEIFAILKNMKAGMSGEIKR